MAYDIDTPQTSSSYRRFKSRIVRSSRQWPVASTPLAAERQYFPCHEFDAVCQRLALDSPPEGAPTSNTLQGGTDGGIQETLLEAGDTVTRTNIPPCITRSLPETGTSQEQEWVWTATERQDGNSSSTGCDDIESNDVRPFDVLSKDGVNPQQTVMKMAAPSLLNDYYTNLLSCSSTGMIALALGSSVYLWNSETCSLEGHLHPRPPLLTLARPGHSCHQRQLISSLCWSGDGRVLSIGTRQGEIQLWDMEQKSRVRCLQSHVAVVGSLSWKQHLLSSGSVLGHIHHQDSRAPKPLVGMAVQEGGVCSLEWSPGDQWLASGSTDGLLSIWDRDIAGHSRAHQPVTTMKQPSAVKAMGWCPWQRQLVATGGGWRDGDLRIWDIQSGTCMTSAHTNSQICSLLWAEKKRALFTGHGVPHHDITCWTWDFPSLSQSYQLAGHSQRVLHLALTPCGTKIISAGADCRVHIWDL